VSRTHIIVTSEGEYGWSMQSPQLPGFVFARPTHAELLRDYRKALQIQGVTGRVIGHHQYRFATPEGDEYLIRVADGEDAPERQLVMNQLLGVMTTEQRFDSFKENVGRLVTGEVAFVCVLANDTIGWLAEQMDPRGEVLNAALNVAGSMVLTTQLAAGRATEGWQSLEDMGWSLDTTMSTVAAAQARGARVAVPV
jgi:hypothetical protein